MYCGGTYFFKGDRDYRMSDLLPVDFLKIVVAEYEKFIVSPFSFLCNQNFVYSRSLFLNNNMWNWKKKKENNDSFHTPFILYRKG